MFLIKPEIISDYSSLVKINTNRLNMSMRGKNRIVVRNTVIAPGTSGGSELQVTGASRVERLACWYCHS